jgi:hypothetical protein
MNSGPVLQNWPCWSKSDPAELLDKRLGLCPFHAGCVQGRTPRRWIASAALASAVTRLTLTLVAIQLLRNWQCDPNATSGAVSSPFDNNSELICRMVNAGGGIRTHTLVPQERILSPQRLPRGGVGLMSFSETISRTKWVKS